MARVYVGTYGKYNNGSIAGAWIDLAKCETYKDFLHKCKEVHKGEKDPEFMIQDSEGFPDGLDCMEWLNEQDFNDVKLAMKEEEQIAQGKPAINIIDYSEKAFAVVGDTKAVKDQLKKLGGRFNSKLSCGAGWIFSNRMRQEVEKFIQSGEVAEAVKKDRKELTMGGEQFVKWLEEYKAITGDDYDFKNSVGAIKLHDHFYIIDKPHIETRFCFHDEGPQYDYYKKLMADKDNALAAHFMAENLDTFDRYINRIEKGEDYTEDKRVWWKAYDKSRLSLLFYNDRWIDEKGYTLCSDEEKEIILKGLKFGRACFKKRLDAYLKRYGVSKLHTWTYWADA